MAREARPDAARDPFSSARGKFESMVEALSGTAPATQSETERGVVEQGTELMRQLMQARLDLLFQRERAYWAQTPREPGVEIRARDRQLEGSVGRLVVWRFGIKGPEDRAARFSMDEQLNLPADLYSYPLRERMADEGRRGAWEQAVEQIDERTGGHVPKRQAEQLAIRAAQDFEAFYEQRPQPANDTLSEHALLVMSADSKGITMRPEALRDATRKAAEEAAADAVKGDPMAAKPARRHDKRMAIVTAVWEQEPHKRTAKDVVDKLRPDAAIAARKKPGKRKKAKRPRPPRPVDKRVWASAEKSEAEGVAEMFDEADRRDPERRRTAVVLVDGDESQETAIYDEGRRHNRGLIIVLDIIHALHYLWLAGFALNGKDPQTTEAWVVRFLTKLLTGPVENVIADIQRSVAQRGLTRKQRKPVDKCLKYFDRHKSMMAYPVLLAQGLPIATGVIEGACRHLVQDRLGITGARWGLQGAEAVLKLRALRSSGDWDDYWRFHERQEALRNYNRAA
jgi:hypothetical protein